VSGKEKITTRRRPTKHLKGRNPHNPGQLLWVLGVDHQDINLHVSQFLQKLLANPRLLPVGLKDLSCLPNGDAISEDLEGRVELHSMLDNAYDFLEAARRMTYGFLSPEGIRPHYLLKGLLIAEVNDNHCP
jgi:hypothetical protein